MRVTETELTDLLDKVYEGMGLAYGDYQACARALVWCAMWGVLSVDGLEEVLDDWRVRGVAPAGVHQQDGTSAIIEAGDNPGLLYSGLALNFVLYLLDPAGSSTLTLQNAPYPFLILSGLTTLAKAGVTCTVSWQNGAESATLASIKAYETYPHVNLPVRTTTVQTLTLQGRREPSQAQKAETLSHPLRERYEQSSQFGLEMSERVWARLKALSKQVLVPASEQSRRGAGE